MFFFVDRWRRSIQFIENGNNSSTRIAKSWIEMLIQKNTTLLELSRIYYFIDRSILYFVLYLENLCISTIFDSSFHIGLSTNLTWSAKISKIAFYRYRILFNFVIWFPKLIKMNEFYIKIQPKAVLVFFNQSINQFNNVDHYLSVQSFFPPETSKYF